MVRTSIYEFWEGYNPTYNREDLKISVSEFLFSLVYDKETVEVCEQGNIIQVIIFHQASPVLSVCRMYWQQGNPKLTIATV